MMPRIIASLITVFAGLTISWSQSNISYVLDASGDYSSQGSKSNISASGQPGGISVSDNGQVVNYAGFLNTFSLQPTLDTDSDGLGDEVDSDNDNDDLGDLAELLGTGFSPVTGTDPNTADSDGDGLDDGNESISGTDPTDANAHLRILRITNTNGITRLTFRGRGGAVQGLTYVIHSHTNINALTPSPVSTNATPAGGIAPWFVVTNIFISGAYSNDARRYFTVEARP